MGTNGSASTSSLTVIKSVFVGTALLVVLYALPAQAAFRYVPQQTMAAPMATAPTGLMPQAPGQLLGQPSSQSSMQSGTVQGFANQVPLTVALRQILPRGTAFQIDNDVDTATQVSWRGGRPWQQTLDDMLGSAGLQAAYGRNSVIVQRGVGTMAMPLPMARVGTAPVALMPSTPTAGSNSGGFAAPAYAAADSMAPLTIPTAPIADSYTPALMEPATETQPYIAPSSMGVANTTPDRNATIGAMQMPVQGSAQGALPEATVGEMPQQAVPGTELGGLPVMQTGALNPLNPGPSDVPAGTMSATAEAWDAHSGQSLHEVLVAWAARAGIELNWVSEYDYPIQASLTFNGTFEEATRTLLGGFVNASPQPIGRLHRNEQLGQQALIIETRGNQYDE